MHELVGSSLKRELLGLLETHKLGTMKMLPLFAVSVLIVGLMSTAAPAFAINCKLAKLPSEKAVCSSKSLLKLDTELNAAYKDKLRQTKSVDEQAKLKKMQMTWVRGNEEVCHAAEACLTQRFQDQLQSLKEGAVSVAQHSSGSLSYQMITVTKTEPYSVNAKYPVISGSPAESVQFLNQWITKDYGTYGKCDEKELSADALAHADVQYNLKVEKLNDQVAAFESSSLDVCGTASEVEVTINALLDVKNRKAYDLWDELSEKNKKRIPEIFLKDIGTPTEECAQILTLGNLKENRFGFSYNAPTKTFLLAPRLSHYESATCSDSASLSAEQVRELFADKPVILGLLKSLQQ